MSSQDTAPDIADNLRLAARFMRYLERGRGEWPMRWQAALATVDSAIIAFFILGPYLRSGPSYLIIDYGIAVWVSFELLSMPSTARPAAIS